jgi:hypothetical protein
MAKWIAERAFDCVDAKGKRFQAVACIGMPTTVPRDGELAAYGSCPVMLEPLVSARAHGGIDQFQALCLAIDLVRRALKAFVAQGGRVFFVGTDTPIQLEDPSFLPHLDLEGLSAPKKTRRKIPGRRR